MIVEAAHFALCLAAIAALLQAGAGLWGGRGTAALQDLARRAALGQCLMVGLAFAGLMHAYVTSDFSVLNVIQNSHSAKPLLYRVAGVWGNHEGSLLLFCLMLALCGAGLARWPRDLPPDWRATALGLQGLLALGFLLLLLLTSNPFLRVPSPPPDGMDLNPLLQDLALAIHPPLLYLGYVGFSLTFVLAVTALLHGRMDAQVARWVRPWVIVAWSMLGLGIALGSWWAYYELGWGGWWFWDPVENAALLPWLVGTALLHSLLAVERLGILSRWTVLLAILTFALTLLGTFLVRSGVLTSVHAFAVDPLRGGMILLLQLLFVGGALLVFALRAPVLILEGGERPAGGTPAFFSRGGMILFNNWWLATAAAVVLIGTLYPLLLEVFGQGGLAVGAPYFNATVLPLFVPLLVMMVLAPVLAWRQGRLLLPVGRYGWAVGLALLLPLVAWLLTTPRLMALAALGLGVWVVAGTMLQYARQRPAWRSGHYRRHAQLLAHIGVGVAVIGGAGSALQSEQLQVLRIGQAFDLAGYTLTLQQVHEERGPNYQAEQLVLAVSRAGRAVTMLRPERRWYPVAEIQTTEAAIAPRLWGDLYVTQGGPVADGWSVRAQFYPLKALLWLGMGLLAGATLLALRR